MKFSFSTFFAIIFACCVSRSVSINSAENGFDAWSKLEISPLAFQHMDYNYKQIDIYAHAKNEEFKDVSRKKYYFIPSCVLNAASAVGRWNDITRQFEVNFQIYMWDQKLKQTVWEFLKTYEPDLKIHQIQVLPIDKVALRCQDCRDFTVQETPLRYSSLPHKVDFKFLCITRDRCDEVASRMKSHPRDFNGLNLIFALQNQRSQTRQLSISSNVAFNGELYTKLRNEFPSKDSAYLTSNDAKKLLAQSVQDVQAAYVSDSDIFDNDFAQQVKSYVERLLVSGREDSAKFRAENWESVFWEQDTARPDVLTNELNEVYSELDGKAKSFLEQVYNEATKAEDVDKIRSNLENERFNSSHKISNDSTMNNTDVGVSVSGGGWDFAASVAAKYGQESGSKLDLATASKNDTSSESEKKSDNSVSKAFKSDSATEFLKKTKNTVGWNGKKFVPKPMSLTRVNIGSQDSTTSIRSQQINLKYYSAALITAVSIPDEELSGDVVVVYQEISDIKKNLSQILDVQKALTDNGQQLKNSIESMPRSVCQEVDNINKSLSQIIEAQKAYERKEQLWQSTVELMRANITEELSTTIKTEGGCTAAFASVLSPLLHNISEQMRDMRNKLDKESLPCTVKRNNNLTIPGCTRMTTNLPNSRPLHYLCEKAMNWNMAGRYCASHGMHLATLDDEDNYNGVKGALITISAEKGWTYPSLWIGATDSGTEGSWYWVSNGQLIASNKWFPNEPNNGDGKVPEDCLLLQRTPHDANVGFNDYGCGKELYFICELA